MNTTTHTMLYTDSASSILDTLENRLQNTNEAQFWKEKVIPFCKAVLSVLIPLRDQDLLFTPEGQYQDTLDIDLLMKWMDFVSLRTLAFIIQDSNNAAKLLRTKMEEQQTLRYTAIDIELLAQYLNTYNVDLKSEDLDFPISSYNIHQGLKNIIKQLL